MLTICRVCLVSGNVKMYSIQDIGFGEIFERLTTNKLCERDMPTTVCYLCRASLQRCRRLVDKASNSQSLLINILQRGEKISRTTVEALHLRESHSLSASVIDLISINGESDLNLSLEGRYITLFKQEKDIKEEVVQYESKTMKRTNEFRYLDVDSSKVYESKTNMKRINESRYLDVNHSSVTYESHIGKSELKNCNRSRTEFCDKCDKSFKNVILLKSHLCHEKDLKNKKYHCSNCSKSFYRKGNLEKHVKSHTKEKIFVCEHCNKKFKQKSHLNVHLRIHTGEKLFACEICGKTFNQIANLNKHKSIHIGIKPFSCEFCNKTFLQRSQVNAHLRTHTGEKPYICDICNKGFSHAVPLRKHIKLHINPKPYICVECYISFDEEIQLNEHLKVHSERSFKCSKCSSSFKDRRSLGRHDLQVHCGERQHICPRCGNAFKRPQHLNKHMASAHCKQLV